MVPAPESKPPGPCALLKANFLRLSFRKGGQEEVGYTSVCFIASCSLAVSSFAEAAAQCQRVGEEVASSSVTGGRESMIAAHCLQCACIIH